MGGRDSASLAAGGWVNAPPLAIVLALVAADPVVELLDGDFTLVVAAWLKLVWLEESDGIGWGGGEAGVSFEIEENTGSGEGGLLGWEPIS